MLEPVGLIMDIVDVKTEGLGEVELEQAVMADHLDCDSLACGGEADAFVRRVVDELERRQLLDHLAGRANRDPLLPGECGDRDTRFALLKLVDRFQVVLDRVGERWTCHRHP